MNFKIYCYKCIYDSSVPRNERHPFSNYSPSTYAKIDLLDWCFSVSPQKFSSVLAEDTIKQGVLRYEAGNFTIELLPDNFLQNYFMSLSENAGDFDRVIHIVEVVYNNNIIFVGYFNHNGINQKYSDDDYENITIDVNGMEKKFKEYYSNKELKSWSYDNDFFCDNRYAKQTAISLEPTTCNEYPYYARAIPDDFFWSFLFDFKLTVQTPALPPEYSAIPGMKRWVNNIPHLHSNRPHFTGYFWWLRSGYKRFYEEKYSVFDLLENSCNANGWKWYIKGNSWNSFELVIINRSEKFNNETYILDNYGIVEYDMGFQQYTALFNYIVIPAGAWDCGLHNIGGASYKMIFNNSFQEYNSHPIFKHVNNSIGIGDVRPNSEWLTYNLDTPFYYDNDYHVYDSIKGLSDLTGHRSYYESNLFSQRKAVDYFLNNKYFLQVDGGSHTTWTGCDLNNRINTNQRVSSSGFNFTGNCGDMFFYTNLNENSGLEVRYLRDYNHFSRTELFFNNFAPMLYRPTKLCHEIEILAVLPNPLAGVSFRQKDYIINSLEINLESETTKMTITEL